MVWLFAWLQRRRGAGWFKPNGAGGFPVPDAWQGWVTMLTLIAALAACVPLPGDYRPPAAFCILAIYAGIVYWTYRAD